MSYFKTRAARLKVYLTAMLAVPEYKAYSGAGSARILQQLCASGYKYDTFSICSSNLPDNEINASQREFFHFQDGYHDFQDDRQITHN